MPSSWSGGHERRHWSAEASSCCWRDRSCSRRRLPLPALLLVLYLGADLLFEVTDRRFWGQMCELRADRTGLRLSGASGEEWMQFWEIARLLQAEEKRQARLRGENVLYQGSRRYLEWSSTPPSGGEEP